MSALPPRSIFCRPAFFLETGSLARRCAAVLTAGLMVMTIGCSDLPTEGADLEPQLDAAETEAVNAVLPETVETGGGSTICQALEGHHQRTLMEAAAGASSELDERAVEMETLITNLCR